jgi:carboxypeptidase C (cathepsin A)
VSSQEDAQDEPRPERWESSHSVTVGGAAVEYDAVVGSVMLRNDDDEITGELTYVAYFRTNAGAPAGRPLIFAYNGGPGSASFWLHLGIMGPRRVSTPVVGQQAPPPYTVVDNGYTLLDIADIVMVDPVGTGFSRPLGEADGSEFWGIEEDAASLSQFVRRFLSEHGAGTHRATSSARATGRLGPPSSRDTCRTPT